MNDPLQSAIAILFWQNLHIRGGEVDMRESMLGIIRIGSPIAHIEGFSISETDLSRELIFSRFFRTLQVLVFLQHVATPSFSED